MGTLSLDGLAPFFGPGAAGHRPRLPRDKDRVFDRRFLPQRFPALGGQATRLLPGSKTGPPGAHRTRCLLVLPNPARSSALTSRASQRATRALRALIRDATAKLTGCVDITQTVASEGSGSKRSLRFWEPVRRSDIAAETVGNGP